MKKYKHLTKEDRNTIEHLIKHSNCCKDIAQALSRNESTIRREILRNRSLVEPNKFNNQYLKYCECSNIFPYVCRTCSPRTRGRYYRYHYSAEDAQAKYESTIKSVKTGIRIDKKTFNHIDSTIKSGLEKNQPLNHILSANKIQASLSTLYRWISTNKLTSKPIDLQKAVRYPIKSDKAVRSSNKLNREGRTYKDYLRYISENESLNVVEMDTVEGILSDTKCLLTFVCKTSNLFFSRLLNQQTNSEVESQLNYIEKKLGLELFQYLFAIILTDNGSEFNNVKAIEFSPYTGERRTKLFYCDPYRSDQKGTIERKHTDLRLIIPKKKSISHLTQEKVDLMNSHVNAILRPTFRNKSSYEIAAFLHSHEILNKLDLVEIKPNDVLLKPSLIL